MKARLALVSALAGFMASAAPCPASATPDPVIASLLSAGSTVLPVAISGGLLLTGRGAKEGIRFDLGMATLGVGAIVGPSVGQIYAGGGVDALVTFVLRCVTGTVMLYGAGVKLRGDPDQESTGTAMLLLGGIPTGLVALYDIYAASVSARESRYREGYAQREEPAALAALRVCGPIPCPP